MRPLSSLFHVFLLLVTAGAGAGDPPCPGGSTDLRWEEFGRGFFSEHCNRCHAFDNYTSVYVLREEIIHRVMILGDMPPQPGDPLPEEDRALLEEWIGCGLPLAGPSCPPRGTAHSFTSFAGGFFARHCTSCHASTLTGEARRGAPPGQDFDVYAPVAEFAGVISSSILHGTMPPVTFVPPSEIDAILEWLACGAPEEPAGTLNRRSDANDDGASDLSDAVTVLSYLFDGPIELGCKDAADVDGSGSLEVTDAVYLLLYLFLDGRPPPPPFSGCGSLPALGCSSFASCGNAGAGAGG